MERKAYQKLLSWKNRGAKKPLLVIGARQVGKTYLIEQFCQSEYENYLFFNLLNRSDIIKLFKEDINTQDKIDRLELLVGYKIDFANTIIFFDEVQESEEIIAACKFFAEAKTDYNIICAGSLLGVKINRFESSFPVGKVETLTMYPMDFEEYLWAGNNRLLANYVHECFQNNERMATALHEKLLQVYRSYLYIGGLPEAVANFIENDSNVLLFNTRVHDDIRLAYLSDMNKYIRSPLESSGIEAVYHSIPAQLANLSRKFMYSKVQSGSKGRDYATAMEWLTSAELVYRSNMVEAPNMPLKGYEKEGFFKLYLNDPGLLSSVLEIPANVIMLDQDFSYKGVLTENYIAGQLIASGRSLYYWRNENFAEIDFLLTTDEGIIPVEVKAGKRVNSPSLKNYVIKFKPPYSVRISSKNFAFDNGIKAVPLYAAFCLLSNVR
jgi:predicted AAA+ superfamily ATPase